MAARPTVVLHCKVAPDYFVDVKISISFDILCVDVAAGRVCFVPGADISPVSRFNITHLSERFMVRRLVWRLILLSGLILGGTGVHAANNQPSVRDIFVRAAHQVALLTSVPVYVPVSIQSLDKYAKDGCAFETVDKGSFNISLHGRVTEYGNAEPLPCEGSNASLLAEIHGDIKPMPNMSNAGAQKIRLQSGSVAWFSPISCGGSCSPATLYWQTLKASYWLQLRLPSDTSVAQQRKELLDTVNSLEVVPTGH